MANKATEQSAQTYTVIGRYEGTGEVVIDYIEVAGDDVHFEVLRHWGQQVVQDQEHSPPADAAAPDAHFYEVLAAFPGEISPSATPETLKKYVDTHFED